MDDPVTLESIKNYVSGKELRSSLMIKNIPYHLTKEQLLEELKKDNSDKSIDYLHLVWDYELSKKLVVVPSHPCLHSYLCLDLTPVLTHSPTCVFSRGFAFINFKDLRAIPVFCTTWMSKKLPGSRRKVSLAFANKQGINEQVHSFSQKSTKLALAQANGFILEGQPIVNADLVCFGVNDSEKEPPCLKVQNACIGNN